MTSRVAGAGFACVVLVGVLAGCGGGDGEGGGGLSSRLPTISPTRTLPTPTRTPAPTNEPTSEATGEATGEPTSEPTSEPESPTTRPTKQETEATEDQTFGPTDEAPSPTSSDEATAPAGDAATDDQSVPTWVWWLLVVVLLAAGILAWLLIARSRRRSAWQEQLQSAEAEVAWLARELLPQLRGAGSLDRAAGGWQVALPRVMAAEDQLTVLEPGAPSEVAGARARALRDAVRQARARMERLASEGPEDVWALDVDDAIADLEAALPHQEPAAP
jgi:hypothetical protein